MLIMFIQIQTDAPGLYVTTRPYVNATFTPAVSHINSVARNEADATHMTYPRQQLTESLPITDGGYLLPSLSILEARTDKITISYAPDGNLYAAATGNTTGANNAPTCSGYFQMGFCKFGMDEYQCLITSVVTE